MAANWGVLVELLLVVGLLVALGVWQWWDLRQWRRRRDEQPARPDPDEPGG